MHNNTMLLRSKRIAGFRCVPAGINIGTQLCAAVIALTFSLPAQQKAVSVCEVLSNPSKYEGRLVKVRARLTGGGRHGVYKTDQYDDRPCPGKQREGITWPSTLYPQDPRDLKATTIGRTIGSPDLRALDAFWSRVRSSHGTESILATFVGEVRFKPGVQIVCDAEGGCGGTGYGQFGMHPAMLILKTIVDVVRVQIPPNGDQ